MIDQILNKIFIKFQGIRYNENITSKRFIIQQ